MFSSTVNVIGGAALANTILTVGVIARYGKASEAVDVFQKTIGTAPIIATNEISVFKSSVNSAGYSVRVQTTRSGDGATLSAIYAGTGPNSNNYTQSNTLTTSTVDTVNIWDADDFSIPENGMVLFVMQEFQAGVLQNIGIMTFPALLDDNMGNIVVPPKIPNALRATITLTFEVRRILMIFTLIIWEA